MPSTSDLCYNTANCTSCSSSCVTKIIQFFCTNSREWLLNHMPGQCFSMSFCWFPHASHLNLLSSFSLPLIPLHLLSTKQLQKVCRCLPSLFLQTAEGNWPSTVTFPAFSRLIIIFVFLAFTFNPFDSNDSQEFH